MPEALKRVLGVAVLAATVLSALPQLALASPAGQSNRYCLGEPAMRVYIGYDAAVTGTSGHDVIVVEGGWNSVQAGAGDDKICVLGHFNSIYAEAGDDDVIVAGLHNSLFGGDDDDVLTVDDPSNLLQGGNGADTCNGDPC